MILLINHVCGSLGFDYSLQSKYREHSGEEKTYFALKSTLPAKEVPTMDKETERFILDVMQSHNI